jgi:hypothetical protein
MRADPATPKWVPRHRVRGMTGMIMAQRPAHFARRRGVLNSLIVIECSVMSPFH